MTDTETRLLLRLALVPIRITRQPDEPDERRFTTLMEAPIFLDDPSINEETKRDYYAVLMRIPWLAPSVRNAIMTHLGKSVARAGRMAGRLQTKAYRDAIARYKEAGVKAPYEKLVILTDPSIKKWKDFSIEERDQLDKKVEAMKMRLYRSRRTK
jgi:hypothetical protein